MNPRRITTWMTLGRIIHTDELGGESRPDRVEENRRVGKILTKAVAPSPTTLRPRRQSRCHHQSTCLDAKRPGDYALLGEDLVDPPSPPTVTAKRAQSKL